jgi:hypothetical protein
LISFVRKLRPHLINKIDSSSSPIGIAIGMVLVNMEKSLGGDIANGILQVLILHCIYLFRW